MTIVSHEPGSVSVAKAIQQARMTYEEVAPQYEASTSLFHTSVVYPRIMCLVERYLGTLDEKKILDIGCGSGLLLQHMQRCGAHVTGIDIARAGLIGARTVSCNMTQGSMHRLPYASRVFDGIVSNYALNYLPPEGQQETFCEIFRVLLPGGVFVMTGMHPFSMRMSRYQPTAPHYTVHVKNYFEPLRRMELDIFGKSFIFYLLDWPELATRISRSGLRIQELIDAEVPAHLDRLSAENPDPQVMKLLRSFYHDPYGFYLVATA